MKSGSKRHRAVAGSGPFKNGFSDLVSSYQCVRAIFIVVAIFTTTTTTGILFSNAQYSSHSSSSLSGQLVTLPCDSSRLVRCQQDAMRDMQVVSLNSASIQYPISGPPYSPKQQAQQLHRQQQLLAVNPSTCRLVRSNLDCLLSTTPACYDINYPVAQNTDIILRAKRFLEQNNCNDPDTNWSTSFCYKSPEVRTCEDRYGFTAYNAPALTTSTNNLTACLAYQAFRYCVDSHLRLSCKVHEMDMINEYLIDRAGDLAWRCPPNSTTQLSGALQANNPYALSEPYHTPLSPSSVSTYNNYAGYEQRPMPTYMGGSSQSGVSLFGGGSRDQPWERFRNPSLDEAQRFGVSRIPSGQVFDRLVVGSGFEPESSDCPVRAAPFARECEDTLMEHQRLARDSRDGNELQRRICCSLFQFRDCISRVVLDRCADSSAAAVEVLMGIRRREMTISCRGFNRDVCSGSLPMMVVSWPVVMALALLASFMTLKHQT